jgi:hypothetical protein
MTREEFIFTIGFQGDAAIVDKRAKRQFGRLGTMELAEKGLYRAAFCSALFSGKPDEMESFIGHFAEKTGTPDLTAEQVKRIFGVYTIRDDIKRVISI